MLETSLPGSRASRPGRERIDHGTACIEGRGADRSSSAWGTPPLGGSTSSCEDSRREGIRSRRCVVCDNPTDQAEARRLFPEADYDVRFSPPPVRKGPWRKVQWFSKPYSYMFSPEIEAAVAQEASAGFNVLHLEHLWGGWLGLEHTKHALINIHYLFRNRSRRSLQKLAHVAAQGRHDQESRAVPAAVLSNDYHPNTKALRASRPDRTRWSVYTVPLGIDMSIYQFHLGRSQKERPVVSLIGSFNWQPTFSAARRLLERLWPGIKARLPKPGS